jgi:ABC-type siderophore export system fused ATPase/permease subunit
MDLDLLVTLVAASIISAIILTAIGIGVYYFLRNKKIKKVLKKILKI